MPQVETYQTAKPHQSTLKAACLARSLQQHLVPLDAIAEIQRLLEIFKTSTDLACQLFLRLVNTSNDSVLAGLHILFTSQAGE